jgi:CRP-like cAMP-binding protein
MFIEANPYELLPFTKHLINGIEGLLKRIELMSFDNAQTRVFAALMYLSHHFGRTNKQEIVIESHFTHEDIAAITGLTRERVSIEMGKLKRAKLISYDTKSIHLLQKLPV